MTTPLLVIDNLSVSLAGHPDHKIIDGVSFAVSPFCITAIVGASGSGKSTTGFSVTRLLSPALQIIHGKIILKGEDLLSVSERRMSELRGKEIGMIFQEPLHAMNPVMTIGSQIEEVLRRHTSLSLVQARKRVEDLLIEVGLDDPKRVVGRYPHQLSGGMRQRVMIAQAIAAAPSLLIADEPTSSLDVTLQAKILELFKQLRDHFQLSIILITHDLGVVSHIADQVVVLECGRVVETGATAEIIKQPKHPYTQKLMQSLKA